MITSNKAGVLSCWLMNGNGSANKPLPANFRRPCESQTLDWASKQLTRPPASAVKLKVKSLYMIDTLLAKVFGTKNEREVKAMRPNVAAITALEPQMQRLSDAELAAKTVEFKQRLADGSTLDDLLTEAFAVVREAGCRALNMRHFDVQLMGGIALHHGKIAEMRTGEGKTLVATLPTYLNALTGKGVHVVTVNDYLARRDAEWMGKLYKFLGLSIRTIHSASRRAR